MPSAFRRRRNHVNASTATTTATTASCLAILLTSLTSLSIVLAIEAASPSSGVRGASMEPIESIESMQSTIKRELKLNGADLEVVPHRMFDKKINNNNNSDTITASVNARNAKPNNHNNHHSSNIINNSDANTSNNNVVTYSSTADATLVESFPAKNYGDWDTLEFIAPTSLGGLSTKVESVIKFRLDDDILVGGVRSAFLKLYPMAGCNFMHLQGHHLGLVAVGLATASAGADNSGSDWNEFSVNWENGPQLEEGGGTMVTPLGGVEAWKWYEIEITSFLTASPTTTTTTSTTNSNNELSLRLSSILFSFDDSFASCTFASKEFQNGIYAPQLELHLMNSHSDMTYQKESISKEATTTSNSKNKPSATITVISNCEPPYDPDNNSNREEELYTAGQVVSNNQKNYQCKPFPFTTWCNSEEYAPGTSSFWAMAWTLVGECKVMDQSIHKKGSEMEDITTIIDDGATTVDEVMVVSSVEKVETATINAPVVQTSSSSSSSFNGITNPCPPAWQLGHAYHDLEKITDRDTLVIYECKEWPLSSVCGNAAYEVGIGPLFRDVWREVGTCVDSRMELLSMNGGGSNAPTHSPTREPTTPFPTFLLIPDAAAAAAAAVVVAPSPPPAMRPTNRRTHTPTKLPTNAPVVEEQRAPIASTLEQVQSRPLQGEVVTLQQQEDEEEEGKGYSPLMTQDLIDGRCGPPYDAQVTSYSHSEVVSHEGLNFVCTLPEWCGVPDFEPIDGKFWKVVWVIQGPCLEENEEVEVEDAESTTSTTTTSNLPMDGPAADVPPENGPASLLTLDPDADDESGEPECAPIWVLGRPYVEGNLVGSQGQDYSCKPFPFDGWCGLEGYEPTVGAYWTMAWDVVRNCVGEGTRLPTPPPTMEPIPPPTTTRPTRKPTESTPSTSNNDDSSSGNGEALDIPNNGPAKGENSAESVFNILDGVSTRIDGELFLYQGTEPSSVYRYEGFIAGLKIMFETGVAGKFFYLGDDSDNGHLYGLVNIAAFLGQSMKETIQYDACDENSWDLVNSKYPLSNACGQLGQSYQDYHCSEEEKHMECAVDPNMSIKGVTHAKWYGAPGPLFCGPKSEYPETGFWDYGYGCNNPWAEPPEYCMDYEGQKAGRYDNSMAVENNSGRSDVEGCCWWGRGVIQTTGVCNFGKLNYFLGARAAEEGRPSRYPTIDFCKDPEVICASQEHQELKWIAGMFYWVESLQSYNERGWEYYAELHKFVDGGMSDHSFINAVSGIVNRGCHDPPCGTGDVDGMHERAGNFEKVLSTFL